MSHMPVPDATSAMTAVLESEGKMEGWMLNFKKSLQEVELEIETTGGSVFAVAVQNVSMTVDQGPVSR